MPEAILDMAEVLAAAEEDRNAGFCTACGEETCSPVEPDACNYKCEACGAHKVFGAEELVLTGGVEV